jgi:hypothetical protein
MIMKRPEEENAKKRINNLRSFILRIFRSHLQDFKEEYGQSINSFNETKKVLSQLLQNKKDFN